MKLLLKLIIALLCVGFIATLSFKPDVLLRFKQDGLKAFLPKSAPAPQLPSILPKTPTTTNKAARKQIYRWKDDKGQWHYTDVPPPSATSAESFTAPHPNQNVLSFEGVRAQVRAQEQAKTPPQKRVHIIGEDQPKPSNLKDSPALQGIKDMEQRQAEQQKILDQL